MLLALVASAVTHQYWLQPKYVIFSAPFALWFLAFGFQALPGRLIPALTAVLGAVVVAISLAHFWNPADYGRRENWREVSHYLRDHITPGSVVIVVPGTYWLMDYYWPAAPAYRVPVYVPDIERPAVSFVQRLRSRIQGKSDVYYLWWDIRQNIVDPRDVLLHSLDYMGVRADTQHLNPRFKLYHWSLNRPQGS